MIRPIVLFAALLLSLSAAAQQKPAPPAQKPPAPVTRYEAAAALDKLAEAVVLGMRGTKWSPPAGRAPADVPGDHWARAAVARSGRLITSGARFEGARPITRFEAASALANLARAVDREIARSAREHAPEVTRLRPGLQGAVNVPASHPARRDLLYLVGNDFLPRTSPLLRDGGRAVLPGEFQQALGQVSGRLIARHTRQPAGTVRLPDDGHRHDR